MNFKRYITILLSIILYATSLAQNDNLNKDLIIKANLTSLVDFFTFPTARISLEKNLNDYFSINGEVGIQLFNCDTGNVITLFGKGYKVNIEGRFYITKLIYSEGIYDITGCYLGIQGFYRHHRYLTDVEFQRDNNKNVITDVFCVDKTAYGINFLLGYQVPVTHKMIIDIYIGTGNLTRKITNTGREYKTDESDVMVKPFLGYRIFDRHLSETSGKTINFLCGCRIGYTIQ